MKNIFYTPALAIFLVACNSGLGSNNAVIGSQPAFTLPNTPEFNLASINSLDSLSTPALATGTNNSVAQAVAIPNAQDEAPDIKLNPEHGKPGHNCAISVGAPLIATPTTTTTAPINNLKNITNVSQPQTATNVTTSDIKLNPAHGKPGHNCAIAVGAPLN